MTDENQNQNKWCFSWFAERAAKENTRAALARAAKWNSRDQITVTFLDGDPAVQSRVRDVAGEWTVPGMANLSLIFQQNPDSMIRISFLRPGSWSMIGTTCMQVTDRQEPTMNYGWLNADSTDEELHRVVLHEFGHALGLIHEHQSPAEGINWDRAAVTRDLSAPPNNWPLDVIETNMFKPFSEAETNFTELDPQSIMMYPIPATWTLDGFSVGLNSNLSESDKAFIRQRYG
jgi:serralysin